jgi:hypothetical protein
MDKKFEQVLTFKEWEKEKNTLFAYLKKKFDYVLTPRKR